MFMLLFLLPFGGLEILAPIFLWILSAPRWHPLLASIYGAFLVVLLIFWVRGLRREQAEHRLIAATHATWRWPRRASPEFFRVRLAMFLRLGGWRVDNSAVTERGRVKLVVRKDRNCIVLLCVGPRQDPADAEDFAYVNAMRVEVRATHAAIVGAVSSNAPADILQFRFANLARLDQATGQANHRLG
jgi:hypothetical protein